ncbi:MAG: glycosyltransferase family 2 protein [Sphingobacteriales bacterium]|nr:MAG: glycosyltransferase family 2 protein [Sphingobacteriales bacterium]
MQVSIVIVNYKQPNLTIQCVNSIIKHTLNIKYEIIVVDNCSKDDSKQIISNKFHTIKYIQLDENIGYSRANNIGINISTGKYILVLNNDTIFIENILFKLCQLLDEKQNISAACVQLYYEDMTKQLSGSNFVFLGLNVLLTFPYISNILKYIVKKLKVKKPHPSKSTGKEKVDWISGAFMFVRRKDLINIGAFDEDFFLFSEEAEWCYRLNQVGYVVIFPELSLIHLGGKTMSSTITDESENYYPYWDKKGLQLMVSNLLRIRKQYGVVLTFIHLMLYFFASLIDVSCTTILYMFTKLFVTKNKYSIEKSISFMKNSFVLLRYFPSILIKRKKLYKVI